jgi:hypothetical protein
MESAVMEIELGRKRERHYGEWLVKVPRGAAPLLEAHGWVLVHDTGSALRGYVGMRPPSPGRYPDHTVYATVEVPSLAEMDALARERHAEGRYWQGLMGVWTASYDPAGASWSNGKHSLATFRVGGYRWGYSRSWTDDGEELGATLDTGNIVSRVEGWCDEAQPALFS